MKVLKVRVETHYGKHTVYPVCKKAQEIATLLGTRTIAPKTISLLKLLGYEIENIYNPLDSEETNDNSK